MGPNYSGICACRVDGFTPYMVSLVGSVGVCVKLCVVKHSLPVDIDSLHHKNNWEGRQLKKAHTYCLGFCQGAK